MDIEQHSENELFGLGLTNTRQVFPKHAEVLRFQSRNATVGMGQLAFSCSATPEECYAWCMYGVWIA